MDLIKHWLHISHDGGRGASELLIGLRIITGFTSSFEGAQVAIRNSQPGGTGGDPMYLLGAQVGSLHSWQIRNLARQFHASCSMTGEMVS